MKYMTLQAMAEACHGVYIGNPEDIKKEAISITTDSRKAERGGVFAAIKGERVDGHDFIPGVLEAGALCVISEKQPVTEQGNYIIVEDTVRVLPEAACYSGRRHHRQCREDKHKGNGCVRIITEIPHVKDGR